MTHPSHDRSRTRRSTRKRVAAFAALTLASGLLAACSASGDSGTPELVWYINPDAGGQDAVAENCSDAADGNTRSPPRSFRRTANQQRIQLARRTRGRTTRAST